MQRTFQFPRAGKVIVEFLSMLQSIHEQNFEYNKELARVTRFVWHFHTFSDAVDLPMSDNCGLDEGFENLGRGEFSVLYGFYDLQT